MTPKPSLLNEIISGSFNITPIMLLVFAIMLEIPIMMILLSRVLNYKINRLTNIIASIVTILFVVAGGSLYPHYIFFATIEIICLLLIIRFAWNWPEANSA